MFSKDLSLAPYEIVINCPVYDSFSQINFPFKNWRLLLLKQ